MGFRIQKVEGDIVSLEGSSEKTDELLSIRGMEPSSSSIDLVVGAGGDVKHVIAGGETQLFQAGSLEGSVPLNKSPHCLNYAEYLSRDSVEELFGDVLTTLDDQKDSESIERQIGQKPKADHLELDY